MKSVNLYEGSTLHVAEGSGEAMQQPVDLLGSLFPATVEFALVVDNAKSHSDLYKEVYRRKRRSLLSHDLAKLDTLGRCDAICECFEEIKTAPRLRRTP